MKLLPHFTVTYLLLLFGLLMGCATTDFQPRTLKDQLAISKGTLTGVYTNVAKLRALNKITKEQGAKIIEAADEARLAINTAIIFADEKPTTALEQLQIANNILLQLEVMLAEVPPDEQ